MKKTLIALVAAVALASTAAASQATKTAPKSTDTKQTAPAKPAVKSAAKANMMTAEVVSVDAAAKTITVKGSDGNSQTLTATGAAVAQLSHVKAGESVRVAVDGTNATRIVKAPAKPASKKK